MKGSKFNNLLSEIPSSTQGLINLATLKLFHQSLKKVIVYRVAREKGSNLDKYFIKLLP